MERRKFIQQSVLATTAVATAGLSLAQASAAGHRKDLYEWRVYEMRWGQAALDQYLSQALIPALNRLGIKKIGAFGEMGKSEPLKLYLLIPYSSFEEVMKAGNALKEDKEFEKASAMYNNISPDQAVYSRYDSSFMVAFDAYPEITVPLNEPRIFEVRTYEGYSEDAVRRKIKMFNDEEMTIFNRAKLKPVFFSEVISGPGLPCLRYMLTFKNMEERDQAWQAFGSDADWKRISGLPEYANTVSKVRKIFLEPLAYSQV